MPLDFGELVLRGQRVLLRPLAQDDAAALADAAAENRANYQFNPVPDGLVQSRAYIEHALRQRQSGERYPFTILFDARVAGTTSYSDYQPWTWPPGSTLQRHDRPDVCEIGYTWLAASAQRTACNTEAKFLLLAHAFESWQVHRVCLRTDVRNDRSRRAIERLGAAFEGVRRADKPARDGQVRDSAFYSIINKEWPQVRDRLLKYLRK